MGSDDKKSVLPSTTNGWKIARFEPEDEYLQDMSHEDMQSLALKLKSYGQAADPLPRNT